MSDARRPAAAERGGIAAGLAPEGLGSEALWVGFLGILGLALGLTRDAAWGERAGLLAGGAGLVVTAAGLWRAIDAARLVAAGIAACGAAYSIAGIASREAGAAGLAGELSLSAFEILIAAALLLPRTRESVARRRAWIEARRMR